MTLIVASLFLPFTVKFELRQDLAADEALLEVPNMPLPPARKNSSGAARSSFTAKNDSTSILKTMAKNQQLASSADMYSSLNSTRSNLLATTDDLSKASVEDFFYHHAKLKRSSSNSPSQFSSGLATPTDDANGGSLASQLHNLLLRSVLNNSTYIQPRARTPPVINPSAVAGSAVLKKELQTPGLKMVPKNVSSTNLSGAGGASTKSSTTNKSSLYKLTSKKQFSSSEHIPGASDDASYELVFDDSGIEMDSEPVPAISFDVPDKITPFGGFSNPEMAHPYHESRCDFFATAPFEVVKLERGNVSLTKALDGAIANNFIDSDMKWVGTIGMPSDEVPDSTRTKIQHRLSAEYKLETVFVDDTTFQGHYKSFCKQILWPSMHYQIPDDPKSKVFEEHSWKYYQKVNELFAKKIVDTYSEGDVIWVHDYHLLLVPQLVRKAIPNAKIGLFLHISFPSSEVFRCFAQRNYLLEGMLGANVISFQTEEYVRHFVQTCNRLLLSDYTPDGIKFNGRTIKINHIPVGIDLKSLKTYLEASENVQYWKRLIRQRWPNKRLVVTRDKLDRIRGIKQKLLLYEKFLTKNPEYLDEVILIQICLPSNNADDDLESSISTIVDRINARSNNISILQPVVFLNQDIDFEQYLGLLTEADTFIVSSMREGMNLTCHEFIVSTYEKHSPLILSEFTGSASILNKGTILINPWDIKQVSLAFEDALKRTPEENLKNWEYLNNLVYKRDSNHWVKDCVNSILSSWDDQHSKVVSSTCTRESFLKKYHVENVGGKRVFLFNLENLTSAVQYENSKLDTVEFTRVFSILNNLTADPLNAVYVMSYFKKNDLLLKFRSVSNLGLVAENGGYVRLHDSKKWYSLIDDDLSWKDAVVEFVSSVVERLPHSSIEIEDCTVRFHTENVKAEDAERKITLTGDMITHINDVFAGEKIHATWFNDVVVIQQNNLPAQLLQLICNAVVNKPLLDSDLYKDVPQSPSSVASFSNDGPHHQEIDRIGFLCVIGHQSPTDESLFQYGNELENTGKVDTMLSIEVGKVKTSLLKQYVGGVNELFNILKCV